MSLMSWPPVLSMTWGNSLLSHSKFEQQYYVNLVGLFDLRLYQLTYSLLKIITLVNLN